MPRYPVLSVEERDKRRAYCFYEYAAARRGIEFSITPDELWNIIQRPCLYCGYPPVDLHPFGAGKSYLGNGVDRFSNDRGYVTGNCVSCCSWCNYAKRRTTASEFYVRCVAVVENMRDSGLAALFALGEMSAE